jgi:hypothetical protein
MRDEDDRADLALFRGGAERALDAVLARNLALPSATPSTVPATPLPTGESEVRRRRHWELAPCASATTAIARGARWQRSTLASACRPRSAESPGAGSMRNHLRPPFGERAGLVDDEGVDLLHLLERFGVADEDAVLRALADAHHDRHRRRQAEAHGQAMMSTATAATSAWLNAGDGPQASQATKVSAATTRTTGTNHPATRSAIRWIGARLRCAAATM